MNELINYNATLNVENEKSNLDAVIGSTNPLVQASDKIYSGHSVNNSVIANESATQKDISPTILDLKVEEINHVILPVSSTTQTSIFSNDVTSKSSISDTEIDTLTGLKVNEAVIDNSKPDSLTNPSASQSQTLTGFLPDTKTDTDSTNNKTEQSKGNVTPATSQSKTPDVSITSTENVALASLDSGSTTAVPSEQPFVTTESSASVTGDEGAIVSDTPKNPDSAVVTNNNSGAIASEVSKSDTAVVTTAAATSDPAKTETDVTSTNSGDLASNNPAKNPDSAVVTNNNSEAIASEVSKSDTPVVTTAAATSDPAKTETEVTSANSDELAPAIEKPSVSVVETSPVTNKTAVTSESENKAIASTSDITDSSQTPKNSINSTSADVTKTSITSTPAQNITQLTSESFTFNTGVFKVDETGKVGIDYLFDGGRYEGELGIFNLDGMEKLAQNSDAFITEAARRAVSNSNLGYVVINDATEGARFKGALPYDINRDRGEYKGVKTFTMLPGDRFALILIPNGANLQQVANKSATGHDARPLFSLPMANPNGSFMTGQIADVTGVGNTFVMEDLRVDKPGTDSDYNDIIFQVRGATGSAVSIDSVINPKKEWRSTDLGKALTEYANAYVTPENPKVGELVTDELYDSVFGNTDKQVDNASETGAIASEVSKSDTPVVTAPATSDPAKTETEVTSTNSDELAPAIEKPSVSVEETSPVPDKAAVTSETEDQAIAPLDSGSTTPVSPQQSVVTTESPSSVTGDAGAIVSNTSPTNPDSVVVTDNNSDDLAPAIEKPSVSVVETSPVTDKTAVTSESHNQPLDSVSTTPGSPQQPVVIAESSSSVTEDGGAIASDTPKTSDSAVVTDNNSGAIAPSNEETPVIDNSSVTSSSSNSTNAGEVTETQNQSSLVVVETVVVTDATETNSGEEQAIATDKLLVGDNVGAIASTLATNSETTAQSTVVETSNNHNEVISVITSTTTDSNPASTTQQTVEETVVIEGEEIGAIADNTSAKNSNSTESTLSQNSVAVYNSVPSVTGEHGGVIAPVIEKDDSLSTTEPSIVGQVSTPSPLIGKWLNNIQEQLAAINQNGDEVVNNTWRELQSAANYSNEWLNYTYSQLGSNTKYANEWLNYTYSQLDQATNYTNDSLKDTYSQLNQATNYTNDSLKDTYSQLGSKTDYANAWLNYAQSQLNWAANYTNEQLGNAWNTLDWTATNTNEWFDWSWNKINSAATNTNAWLDWSWNQINSAATDSNTELGWAWNQLYNLGVDSSVWSRYNSLEASAINSFNNAWSRYTSLSSSATSSFNNAWSRYNSLEASAINSFNNAWSRYDSLEASAISSFNKVWERYYTLEANSTSSLNNAWNQYYTLEADSTSNLNNAWNQYSTLASDSTSSLNNAWNQYYALEADSTSNLNNAWNQYSALASDSTSSLNNSWNQYSALASDSTSSLNNAGNQYSALNNAWDDWVSDTEAEMNVWAKIAASENRWYKTSLADTLLKAGLPLVGIIDTGFRVNNPDIDSSRISLGKDWIDGDNNPLLQLGEGDEHGTQMLEIIAATRNNNIGLDGINDRSPLWLGRAVGSGDWGQSLIEFVDAAKASEQPNAVINLSFDLTQTNPDGSVTTRYELTALERAALTYAQLNNVLIVAAAGNENSTMSALGQATKEFDNIITVGAAEGWNRANYSSYSEVDYANYGKGVDILAQGSASNGASGTSVAAAKVTGAASLMWSANPQLNYSQVIDILKRTATDLNTPNRDPQTGLGLLNIHAAVYLAKATQPEVYTLGSLEFVQDTLKTNHIPEVYWPEFYELYHYYDLEAKYERQAWSGKGGATATERADGWKGGALGAAVGGAVGGVAGAVVGAAVGNYIENRSGGGSNNAQAVQQAQEKRDQIKKEGNKAVDAAKENVNAAIQNGQGAIAAAENNVTTATQNGQAAIAAAENNVTTATQNGQAAIAAAENNVNARVQEAETAITDAEKRLEYAQQYAPETVEILQQELAQIKGSTAQTIAQAKKELEHTKTTVQQTIAQAKQELEQTKTTVQQTIALAEQELAHTKQYYQRKLAEADEKLQKAKEDFERERKSNNPFKQFANDLEKGLKSSLDGIDVGAVVDALKKIPVVGTVVNGIEGLIALVQNDWKGVVKSGINGVLKIIPGGSAVPEKVVNILIDVGWGIISKDYKTALKDVLKELEVKDKVANTFVDVAWAMKDGDWKGILGAGLSGAGFSNADKFVGIAWGVKDGDYNKALTAGLEVAGLDKLGINSSQSQAFVKSALALKDNQTSKVADELLSVAGTQFTNSSWVRDLKDSNPNNDRAAVTQGLSAVGFKNVEQWVNMAWDVKEKNYLSAISTGFSLAGFTQGKDWVDMAWSLQQKDYLKALSTGFKVAGFAEGEHLGKAAVNLREGKYLDAFFEGIRLVPGVGDLIKAFEAVGDGNFKGVANSLAKVATNPTLLKLLVS